MKFSRSALTVAVLVAAAFSASAQNIAIVNGKAVPKARVDTLQQRPLRGVAQPPRLILSQPGQRDRGQPVIDIKPAAPPKPASPTPP